MRNRYHGAMTNSKNPRIALGCFMLESNGHSPVATREEFAQNYLEFGEAMMRDWQTEHPRGAACMSGFVDAMNKGGGWTPLPLRWRRSLLSWLPIVQRAWPARTMSMRKGGTGSHARMETSASVPTH